MFLLLVQTALVVKLKADIVNRMKNKIRFFSYVSDSVIIGKYVEISDLPGRSFVFGNPVKTIKRN